MIKTFITQPTVFHFDSEYPWTIVDKLCETISGCIETLGDDYVIELFSFPSPPSRLTHPEATGLRHLAFEVEHLDESVRELNALGISHEPLRTDEYTGKRFLFFQDPDGLPIELYEK